MTIGKIPYFMTNKEWYTIDANLKLVLTDKAPQEAVKSYNELHKALDSMWEEKRKATNR